MILLTSETGGEKGCDHLGMSTHGVALEVLRKGRKKGGKGGEGGVPRHGNTPGNTFLPGKLAKIVGSVFFASIFSKRLPGRR